MWPTYYKSHPHTAYSCDISLIFDVRDWDSGLLRPFGPQFSLQDTATRLCNFNHPKSKLSVGGKAALGRIEGSVDLVSGMDWGADTAFLVRLPRLNSGS